MSYFLKSVLVITVISIAFFSYNMRGEATSNYFGGLAVGTISCNSGSVQSLTIFFPLYLNGGTPSTGFLGTPNSITYSNYSVSPGKYALGTYQPGAAVCLIGQCPYCISIPNSGLILPFTGSSQ